MREDRVQQMKMEPDLNYLSGGLLSIPKRVAKIITSKKTNAPQKLHCAKSPKVIITPPHENPGTPSMESPPPRRDLQSRVSEAFSGLHPSLFQNGLHIAQAMGRDIDRQEG